MNYKWGIFFADLDPVIGSEQQGKRPVLVISDEDFNSLMPVVTVLPLTSLKEGRRVYPNEVLLKAGKDNGLTQDSLVLAYQIRTISKSRLRDLICYINEYSIQEAINETLRVHLDL